ncbi:SDR family oxidoreductase [Streptomyces sp. NRRL B-1140]|uniref:SDR family oxidoreductase n=1 Tax=Streptomyces sp. NRRL B-1140 TaxID=1415549 RepID=UPI001F2BB9F7|nr:SDR family oxidoreductase [Streptomyces sp. NRRL B-1140]
MEIESRAAEAPAPAKERGGRGVDVIATAPGRVAGDSTRALCAESRHDQAVLGRTPAGRRSHAGDLAAATVFLASPAPDRIDGVVLPVDGGRPGR